MAKSPFAAGPEDDRDTEERVKKMRREAEEAEEREDPEIDDDEAEPEEDKYEVGAEDDEPDGDQEEDRPSRRDRRRDRGRSLVAAERDRAERAEREAAENKRLLFEALSRQQQHPTHTSGQLQQADPERQRLDQEAKDLRQQLIALNGRFHQLQTSKQLTPELEARMQEEGFELQDRLQRNAVMRHAPRPQHQNPAVTEQAMVQAANRARFMSEHGDIAGSPVARAYFQAEWVKLLQSRAPDDWDTLNRAAESARRLAGLPARGGRPAPSAGQKRKYSGVGRGGGSGGSERGETVTMTKEMKQMADAAYAHIKDPKKRYQYYVNRVAAKTQKRA